MALVLHINKIAIHFHDGGEFNESDHPRAENGKFGSGGGSGKAEKPKHSPEQMAKWAAEKKARESAQASNSEKERQENKAIMQRAISSLHETPIAKSLNKEQISSIVGYYESGDKSGANAEGRNQVINAIEEEAKKRGLTIEKVSKSQGGKSKSLYIRDGDKLIRVSDHELPMTAEREHNRANGLTGKWDKEIIVTDWRNTPLDHYFKEMKGE